jgi:hypothetical protein
MIFNTDREMRRIFRISIRMPREKRQCGRPLLKREVKNKISERSGAKADCTGS